MRKIGIGKRFDVRARKSETPIFDALTRCIVEFAKAGIVPSQLIRVIVSPSVYDALYAEQKHGGEYLGEPPWINISGVVIQRGSE